MRHADAVASVKARIDALEEAYEFFLAYAAQGLRTDRDSKTGGELRRFLAQAVDAVEAIPGALSEAVAGLHPPAGEGDDVARLWERFSAVVEADARAAEAALRLVAAQPDVSSQLVDNLNANVHLRALLTDLFLVDELLPAGGGGREEQ